MHGKSRGKTKRQQAIDHLRNNPALLTCEASELPVSIASQTTWQVALQYVRSNSGLWVPVRNQSKYFSRKQLRGSTVVGRVVDRDKLDRAVAAYALAGEYEDESKETVAS